MLCFLKCFAIEEDGRNIMISFNILGDCVSRDIVPQNESLVVKQYVSFTSPLSLTSPKNIDELLPAHLSEWKGNDFTKRCLRLDFNKQGMDYLFSEGSEYLIIDILDARMKLLQYKNSYYTVSNGVLFNEKKVYNEVLRGGANCTAV